MADLNDTEVRAFILRSTATTWSEIAIQCEQTFGADRAWPVALIKTVRQRVVKPGRYTGDGAVMALIDAKHDLITQTALRAEGIALFGADRFPSKTRLAVIISDLRQEAYLEAQAVTGRDNPA